MFGKCERNVNTTLFISVVEGVEQNTLYDSLRSQKLEIYVSFKFN